MPAATNNGRAADLGDRTEQFKKDFAMFAPERKLSLSRAVFGVPVFALFLLGGCSQGPEEETYRDINRKSEVVRRIYACPDDLRLSAEFSDGGTRARILYRDRAHEMSAPAPQLTFVGDNINVLFNEDWASIEEVGQPARRCRRL
ncbi:MAG: hypothetical protein ABS88_01560 [Sphingopyxis sp. SCN 67-31]|nr:MAG: hypothetical protein ABS88_01560 [Sphingopyxis sp. SCN 67-31]